METDRGTADIQTLPTLAVWKFASCDGCQLTLLDCEDELLALAGQVDIAHFLEASSAVGDGPYDLALVEEYLGCEAVLSHADGT